MKCFDDNAEKNRNSNQACEGRGELLELSSGASGSVKVLWLLQAAAEALECVCLRTSSGFPLIPHLNFSQRLRRSGSARVAFGPLPFSRDVNFDPRRPTIALHCAAGGAAVLKKRCDWLMRRKGKAS